MILNNFGYNGEFVEKEVNKIGYYFRDKYSTNITSQTSGNTPSGVNFGTLIGADLFAKIKAKPNNYFLTAFTQAEAGNTSFQIQLFGKGLIPKSSSYNFGSLFSLSTTLSAIPSSNYSKTGSIKAFLYINVNGDIHLRVLYNDAWNANFSIKNLYIEQVDI